MRLTRRGFLGSSAAAAAALSLPGLANASDGNKRLVVVFARGGWDVSYCLDPKPGSSGVDGPELDAAIVGGSEEVRSYGDLRVAVNDAVRPSVSAFFDRWAPRSAIVNGIWVGSIAHAECSVRMLTGTRDGGAPDVGAIGGYAFGQEAPVPYMDLGGRGRLGSLAAYSGKTGTRNQIKLLLDREVFVPAPDGSDLSYPHFVPDAAQDDLIQAFVSGRGEGLRSRRGAFGRNQQLLTDWTEARSRAAQLRTEGAFFADQLELGAQLDLASQAAAAIDLLQANLCRTVALDSRLSWDTHDSNIDQHQHHERLFQGLSALVDGLEAADLMDDTVVLVVSEMTRTPRRNGDDGKDHWPVTSALVVGGSGTPLVGGRTFGATNDSLDAEPVDLATGDVSASGIPMRYEHFAAGILSLLDIDPGGWLPGTEAFRGFLG